MPRIDWPSFLKGYSDELLADEEIREFLPADAVAAGWLGFPGASVEDLTALESRLGVALPPSYREFLATSNGCRTTGRGSIALWPTDQVRWLRDVDQELIDIWLSSAGTPPVPDEVYFIYGEAQYSYNIRNEYLRDMLAISSRDWANQDQLWLNPRVVFEDGEWEAWSFSTEYPGAYRYRSFWDLMQRERELARFCRD